jgi:hypothetical protein
MDFTPAFILCLFLFETLVLYSILVTLSKTGTGTGTNTDTGTTTSLLFDVDMRFMQGVYIGLDGEKHNSTFDLI